ncbi:hypothetical protein [Furfurilactobacillus siliginis]|uniref:Uncharacterized protein n=1 Tax=Furfurilactobacillus siliginis TaxID=348151 RepID=A0A0R2L5G4_9LACO|nr:hypothetical protein [Furfurilactobacillus siliginis]KRN96818.1 hypothetical protein IV55_GL000682 [Furfurilactobacillus siliginis]GEK28480.1 hypothetical protein LSI01_07910 [Furfurilactobacillus siliginis]
MRDQNNKYVLNPTTETIDFSQIDTQNSKSGISEISYFVTINADEVTDANLLTANVKIGNEERNVTIFLTGGSK